MRMILLPNRRRFRRQQHLSAYMYSASEPSPAEIIPKTQKHFGPVPAPATAQKLTHHRSSTATACGEHEVKTPTVPHPHPWPPVTPAWKTERRCI
jgi:hypothetical protein